jgi:anti-sigma-K factor RskA
MNLVRHPALDALCGEYLLGTLRGGARRRFERALREEPVVAARLAAWRDAYDARPALVGTPPSPSEMDRGWQRLARELGLAARPLPWWRRTGLWQGWAAVATVAAVALGGALWRGAPVPQPAPVPTAAALQPLVALVDAGRREVVATSLSTDRAVLALQPVRPVVAGPAQSYELWLIPAGGGAPVSLAVLGELAARIELAPAVRERIVPGATLAVSVEPAGGSPTGAPTGPVILTGAIGG